MEWLRSSVRALSDTAITALHADPLMTESEKRTSEYLRALYDRIKRISDSWLLSTQQKAKALPYKDIFAKDMSEMVQVLIWSDNQGIEDIFVLFVENNIHQLLIEIYRKIRDDSVTITILRFFNVFLESVKKGNILYYLLSNNYINALIAARFSSKDLTEEAELYYVTLLKNISNKLDHSSVKLIFDERLRRYPLFEYSIPYLVHSESMNRIAARTVTLNLLRLNDRTLDQFVIQDKNFFLYITEKVEGITRVLMDAVLNRDEAIINEQTNLILEYFEYFEEIFCLSKEHLNEQLSAALLDRIVVPLYLDPMFLSPSNTMLLLGMHHTRISSFIVEMLLNPTSPARSRTDVEVGEPSSPRSHLDSMLEIPGLRVSILAFLYSVVTGHVEDETLDPLLLLPRRRQKKRRLLATLTEEESSHDDDSQPLSQMAYDAGLLSRILDTLIHPKIVRCSLMSSILSFHIASTLLDVSPSTYSLQESTILSIKNICVKFREQFLEALDSNPMLTTMLYTYEKDFVSTDFMIKSSIQKSTMLYILVARKNSLTLPREDFSLHLDYSVRMWISSFALARSLGLHQIELPDIHHSETPFSEVIDVSNDTLSSCLVQPMTDKVCPPVNLYFVYHPDAFMLVQPDPVQLGKARVYKSFPHQYCKVVHVGSDIFTMDVLERSFSFVEHSQRYNVMLREWEGYRIVSEQIAWKARLVFTNASTKARVWDHMTSRMEEQISQQKERLKGFLEPLCPW